MKKHHITCALSTLIILTGCAATAAAPEEVTEPIVAISEKETVSGGIVNEDTITSSEVSFNEAEIEIKRIEDGDNFYILRPGSIYKGEYAKTKTDGNIKPCILLEDNTFIWPGESLTVNELKTAGFVIPDNEDHELVYFTAIGSQGEYKAEEDPEPNWAYEAEYGPGTVVPLDKYICYYEQNPDYDCLTIEISGKKINEYSFFIEKEDLNHE